MRTEDTSSGPGSVRNRLCGLGRVTLLGPQLSHVETQGLGQERCSLMVSRGLGVAGPAGHLPGKPGAHPHTRGSEASRGWGRGNHHRLSPVLRDPLGVCVVSVGKVDPLVK